MQSDIIMMNPQTPTRGTSLDRIRREIEFARRLASTGLLDFETMDAISKALYAALADLDELEPPPQRAA